MILNDLSYKTYCNFFVTFSTVVHLINKRINMLYTIIALFALAAILGLILISYVLKGKETPKGVMIVHGLFAAVALVLLLSYVFGDKPGPMESAVLFVIAALGGFIMMARDVTGKSIPKWLAVVHGLLAVGGFILLLVFAFNGNS
jgi:hypothetical protein